MKLATPPDEFLADELERWHGPLDVDPDYAYDQARAREDRATDHFPHALAWMTSPRASLPAPLPNPVAVASSWGHRDGGGAPTFED